MIVVADNFCAVHNVGCLAFASQRAALLVAAVAGLFYFNTRAGDIGVVRFDDLCHISHATVTGLHIVSVEYLVEPVFFSEMLVDQLEETFCNFGFYIFAEWWVEPDDFSCAVSFGLRWSIVLVC